VTRYLRVRVDSGVPWPTKETLVRFRDQDLTLYPETDELAPTVLLAYDDAKMTSDHALELVRRFLSSLSWSERGPIQDMEYLDGTQPVWIGKGRGRMVNPNFRADYLPDPRDPNARRALAFYREALTVNSLPYRFLGFSKVLNILYPKGDDQIAWINSTVGQLQDNAAQARVAALRAAGEDVGKYLYGSGRCAVAHAYADPVVDPDNPEDLRRLQSDLPVIQNLAEHLIEHELGIKSQATIWQEHRYELSGFGALLGPQLVEEFKQRHDVPPKAVPSLPPLSLRVRDRDVLKAFQNLAVEPVGGTGGSLVLRCHSHDELVSLLISLNFAQERLEFDPESDVTLQDDGSPQAIHNVRDRIAIMRQLLFNGQLEVWNAEQSTLLGRTDPYIPMNIDLRGTEENLDRYDAALAAEEQQRAGAGSPPAAPAT